MTRSTLKELLALIDKTDSCDGDIPISGVAVDSRLVNPQNLFFALKGAQTDGHKYLGEIAAKGAVAAIVEKSYDGPCYHLPLIYVDDPLDALQMMAKSLLQQNSAKVIAITGSVGKTTTKDFIAHLLSEKYRIWATPGNSNSQTALPLAILNEIQGDEEVLILEMGMTTHGHISKLINIAPPDIALITSVELVHAQGFESLQEIAHAKAEILSHSQTAWGIISADILAFEAISKIGSCRKLSFSTVSPEADFFLNAEKDEIRLHHPEGTVILPSLNIPGRHNLHNFLAAVIMARKLSLTWEQILKGMIGLRLPERRLQIIYKHGVTFVNDSYNASAVSVKAALASLPTPKPGGKTIAVIGEMLELGKFSDSCHHEVAEVALECVDAMICLGKCCQPIWECWQKANRSVKWVMSLDEVVQELRSQIQDGDVILLKGSRANGLWNVLAAFDDRRGS